MARTPFTTTSLPGISVWSIIIADSAVCPVIAVMIYHLVLLKVRATATSEELSNLATAMKSLKDVPGVISVQFEEVNNAVYVGYDDRSRGYTHALLVVLKDKKALEGYDKDSYHGMIKSTVIKPMLDTTKNDFVLAVDWEGGAQRTSPPCCLAPYCNATSYSILAVSLLAVAGVIALKLKARL